VGLSNFEVSRPSKVVRKHHKPLGFAQTLERLAYSRYSSKCGRKPGRKLLRRLFFAFPGGWPGVALLLLRAVLGLVILAEGRFYFGEPKPAPSDWLMGLTAVAAGALLLIGLVTPIAAAVVAAGTAGVGLSMFPGCVPTLFDSRISLLFGLTMVLTIIGLGPGAFSLDARMFGRREIIIPPRTPRLQD
jgi:uncharacterized membrane protein YphA (DoxX/SURF4 family)